MRGLALLILAFLPSWAFAIDTAELGAVSGDSAGIARIEKLEAQLRNMTIKTAHPRIHLTTALIARGRARVAANHPAWATISANASAGDLVSSAFAYQMLAVSDPAQAATYAANVYASIMADTDTQWSVSYSTNSLTGTTKKTARWAIAYDWVYDALTPQQRQDLIAKISTTANISARAEWLRAGNFITPAGDTWLESFHREEWVFYSWRAWPELALAGDVPDADYCYKRKWDYRSMYGDAARTWAYLADGTNVEGYQVGPDGYAWFLDLYSATGINLIDSEDYPYIKNNAEYLLYNIDFGIHRLTGHYGVLMAGGGNWSFLNPNGSNPNWKIKTLVSQSLQTFSHSNSYYKWVMDNELTNGGTVRVPTHWAITNDYYSDPDNTAYLAQLLYSDPATTGADPKTATCAQLSCGKFFAGGQEVNMRTSWSPDAARAIFRNRPSFTKTSHGDFDANSFVLYRKGNLSPDSGMYDVLQGTGYTAQSNYMNYQKNTVAHNDILVIDPANPDKPSKLSSSDPGGVNNYSTRNLGSLGTYNSVLHRPAATTNKILAFQTTPEFDYTVGDAAGAYGDGTPDPYGPAYNLTRLSEYTRTFLFLRKSGSDKGYAVVMDRINSNLGSGSANYRKKWLLHTVTEPVTTGAVVDIEVPQHIYTVTGGTWSAANAQNTAAMFGTVLLPKNSTVRKVGGTGYEFWVDGSTPKNWPINWDAYAAAYPYTTGGPLAEIGTWRLEVIPPLMQNRDIFLNSIYLGDTTDTAPGTQTITTSAPSRIGMVIKDSAEKNYALVFNANKYGTEHADTFYYTVAATTPATTVSHIITEVAPNTQFYIQKDGAQVATAISSNSGVLTFTSVGGITFGVAPETAITPIPSPILAFPRVASGGTFTPKAAKYWKDGAWHYGLYRVAKDGKW